MEGETSSKLPAAIFFVKGRVATVDEKLHEEVLYCKTN